MATGKSDSKENCSLGFRNFQKEQTCFRELLALFDWGRRLKSPNSAQMAPEMLTPDWGREPESPTSAQVIPGMLTVLGGQRWHRSGPHGSVRAQTRSG